MKSRIVVRTKLLRKISPYVIINMVLMKKNENVYPWGQSDLQKPERRYVGIRCEEERSDMSTGWASLVD